VIIQRKQNEVHYLISRIKCEEISAFWAQINWKWVKISQLKDKNTNEIEISIKTTIHQLKNVYIAMKIAKRCNTMWKGCNEWFIRKEVERNRSNIE
jgi:phosphoribosyl-dephospho-CoA transferase